MSRKFLKVNTDGLLEQELAINSSAGAGDADKIVGTDSNGKVAESLLPRAIIDTSAGAADAGKIIKTNASGEVDETFLPASVGANTRTVTAGENLSANDLIYFNGSGQAMKADANTASKYAVGFVKTSITSGNTGSAYFEGVIGGQSGLTPGAKQYLSASSAGAISSTPASGAGDISQLVGIALSATEVLFQPHPPVILV